MWRLVLLAMLVAVWAAAPEQAQATHASAVTGLGLDQTFSEGPANSSTRYVNGAWLVGQPLGPPLANVSSAGACSDVCRQRAGTLPAGCRWFAWCSEVAGCAAANGTRMLGYHDCQLQSAECSQHLEVAASGITGLASGFPVRSSGYQQLAGFTMFPAQGIRGADLECPESVEPGTCAFRSTLAAASSCIRMPECRAMVVFPNGTDGCSEPLTLLKGAGLNPADGYVSDVVRTMQVAESQAQEDSFWLTAAEGNVSLPSDAELAAEGASAFDAANRTVWRGCVWGDHAAYEGEVVALLERVASADACCRACAADAMCTVWNWCSPGKATNGTCSYEDTDLNQQQLSLAASQCELRRQELAVAEIGSPPVLLAKGPKVPFTAGAPLAFYAPNQPGFTRYPGRSVYASGRYSCPGSLRPQAGECVLQGSAEALAQGCAANETCTALLLKPGFMANGTPRLQTTAYYKAEATDQSKWILNPTTIMYIDNAALEAAATPPETGGGGLSTGAIAGIAVGAVVVVAALVGLGWYGWHQHRAAQEAQATVTVYQKSIASGISSEAGSLGVPSGGGSAAAGFGAAGVLGCGPPGVGAGGVTPWGTAVRFSPPHSGEMLSPFGAAAGAGGVSSFGAGAGHLSGGSSGGQPGTPGTMARKSSMARMRSGGPAGVALGRDGSGGSGGLQPGDGLASGVLMSGGISGVLAATSGQAPSSGEVLADLMQHVAQQDERARTMTGHASSGSSEPGQWSLDHLPPRLREWLVDPAEIQYLRWPNGKLVELGQGASACVYKALYNGEVVACKEIDLEASAAMQEAFITEASRLQALRHPNIIAFYGVSVLHNRGIVIMELAEGRDLHSALQVTAGASGQRLFGWARRGKRVALEIAKALNYLHSRGCVHLDVKSPNILLTANGAVRLADVGFSRVKEKTFLSNVPLVGTFAWIAPEILLGKAEVDCSADIFSFGVVLWEIVTGLRPQRGSLRMPLVPQECTQDVCDLVMQCLSENPLERPTAGQLLTALGGMLEKGRVRPSIDGGPRPSVDFGARPSIDGGGGPISGGRPPLSGGSQPTSVGAPLSSQPSSGPASGDA